MCAVCIGCASSSCMRTEGRPCGKDDLDIRWGRKCISTLGASHSFSFSNIFLVFPCFPLILLSPVMCLII